MLTKRFPGRMWGINYRPTRPLRMSVVVALSGGAMIDTKTDISSCQGKIIREKREEERGL